MQSGLLFAPGNISGTEYQEGEQFGFWNTREYIFYRDKYTCQHCKGRSKDNVLNVHHIQSRKTGGDSPANLITLCETCHKLHHQGKIKLQIKRGPTFKDTACMTTMRWALFNRAKLMHCNVGLTYGYKTKSIRISNGLPKSHRVDARCISNHPKAKPCKEFYYIKQVRRHNRQIHKANTLKGGIRKLNQAPYLVKGFRLFDKVLYEGTKCFVFGRRSRGYFDLRTLDGTRIHPCAKYDKLKLISRPKGFLIETRKAAE